MAPEGKGMPFVALRDFSGSNALLEKVFSVFGVTLDVQSAVNAVQKALAAPEDSWDPIFKNHPTSPRLKLYLLGFPISLIFERKLVNELIKIEGDNKHFAYEMVPAALGRGLEGCPDPF